MQGGGQFIVLASHDLGEGTYHVQFDDYGICKAWGSGSKHLDGCDNIPGNNTPCITNKIVPKLRFQRSQKSGNIKKYLNSKGNISTKHNKF